MPDLVAEVVSSGDRPAEIDEKVQMWLDAGVKLVWVLYPTRQVIEVYQRSQSPITLTAAATLDGGSIVPGFSVPVAQVFG